jgi:glucose/arabinose dehydrogenase
LAFEVAGTKLLDRRVLVDDLPVVNTQHGVNGLAAGPDGRLYVSIGNVDILWRNPDAVDDLDVRRPDLLGTILAVDPMSADVEVFASGLRNVFGLTFDPEGTLYGVDNDGATRDGWRAEELLMIQRGKDYGYPVDGTYDAEGYQYIDSSSDQQLPTMRGCSSPSFIWCCASSSASFPPAMSATARSRSSSFATR